MALEQESISMATHLQLKGRIFNALWCFVLLICAVVFCSFLFVCLIKYTEYMAKVAEISTVWKVHICEFFRVSYRKCGTG